MRKIGLLLVVVVVGAVGVQALPASAGHGAHASATRAKLQVRKGKLGRFIVDGRGFTLYLFEKDRHGKSACNPTAQEIRMSSISCAWLNS